MTKLQHRMVRDQRQYEYRTMLEMASLVCRKDADEEIDCMHCEECSCPAKPQAAEAKELLSSEMRDKIRQTMRFSGSRMLASRKGNARWELVGAEAE